MPVPLPSAVAYSAGSVPAWAVGAQATVNAAVTTGWAFGTQRTKDVVFTPAMFGVQTFPANWGSLMLKVVNEYRAAGWGVDLTDTVHDAQGQITSFTLTFSRWPE